MRNGPSPYVECGKLIVARENAELPGLRRLEEKALANGVPGAAVARGSAITDVEPYVRGVAALHSPQTAIVDFGQVAGHLMEDCQQRGGTDRPRDRSDWLFRMGQAFRS